MKSLLTFLDQTFIGISLGQFAAAFGSLILALIAKKILGHVFTRILNPLTIYISPNIAIPNRWIRIECTYQINAGL